MHWAQCTLSRSGLVSQFDHAVLHCRVENVRGEAVFQAKSLGRGGRAPFMLGVLRAHLLVSRCPGWLGSAHAFQMSRFRLEWMARQAYLSGQSGTF